MVELVFLLRTLADLVVGTFLVRWLLSLQRSNARNPLFQSLHRLTNPVILPLRRVLPAVGRTDTATVVALLIMAVIRAAIVTAVTGGGASLVSFALLVGAAVALIRMTLWIFFGAIFLSALLSWVADPYNPLSQVLGDLAAPLLRPIRRYLPTVAGLDLSPLVALVLLQMALASLSLRIEPLLFPYDL